MILNKSVLVFIIRKLHSISNKLGLSENNNIRVFPFNYLITKEILPIEAK